MILITEGSDTLRLEVNAGTVCVKHATVASKGNHFHIRLT